MTFDAALTRYPAAPPLETTRLLLRPHELRDLSECTAMWADPEIARPTIGDPSPAPRTWLRILSYRGHWQLLGFGYWAVEEKSSASYIGEVGFADFRRGLYPVIEGLPELGWVLAAHAHGKGYATEALRAVVDWGDRHFGSLRTACIIRRDNHRSFRVADKLGYRTLPVAAGAADALLVRSPPGRTETARHTGRV
jgi:RimJ/RimL family protein N-acetyltransferase